MITYFLSSEIYQIIGLIFAIDAGYLSSMDSYMVNNKFRVAKFGLKN